MWATLSLSQSHFIVLCQRFVWMQLTPLFHSVAFILCAGPCPAHGDSPTALDKLHEWWLPDDSEQRHENEGGEAADGAASRGWRGPVEWEGWTRLGVWGPELSWQHALVRRCSMVPPIPPVLQWAGSWVVRMQGCYITSCEVILLEESKINLASVCKIDRGYIDLRWEGHWLLRQPHWYFLAVQTLVTTGAASQTHLILPQFDTKSLSFVNGINTSEWTGHFGHRCPGPLKWVPLVISNLDLTSMQTDFTHCMLNLSCWCGFICICVTCHTVASMVGNKLLF